MTKELILLRHGKSDWKQDIDDFHRPLKKRGKLESQKIGVWLAKNNAVPDYVISSPAVRAFNTAEKACKTMGYDVHAIAQDERLYLAACNTLIDVIKSCSPEVKRLMLVGHNPGMEELLVKLARQQVEIPEDGNILPTATLAVFKIDVSWDKLSAKNAELSNLFRARDLDRKFPFPDENGRECRDRPAYYYYQSSVIPYRVVQDKIEVLVIRSSSGKNWIFPKGISDPGSTARESAAREAFEEAGVRGITDENSIGEYNVDKWGATCQVLVYPMQVTEVISEDQWQENHRGRKWLTIEKVSQYIANPELLTMLVELSQKFAAEE